MHATDTEIIQNKVRSTKNLMQKSALHMQEYFTKKKHETPNNLCIDAAGTSAEKPTANQKEEISYSHWKEEIHTERL